jgi:hypothetical protein
MLGLLLPLLVTSVAGALWVGSLAGLQRLRIVWWPLALGSIAVQLVLFNPPIDRQSWALDYGPWIWVLSLVGMLAVLVRNSALKGPARYAFVLAAVGVAANLFVVVANGGYMPQSPQARFQVRGMPLIAEGSAPRLRNVAPAGPDTQFAWMGDMIPQPIWLPTANVVSIGDLALSLALALWALLMITSYERTVPAPRQATTAMPITSNAGGLKW